MIFTSFNFFYFFAIIFCLYLLFPQEKLQNVVLLVASYVFYGWINLWFCLLLVASTIVDFGCGLGMKKWPSSKKLYLAISLMCNLGILADEIKTQVLQAD